MTTTSVNSGDQIIRKNLLWAMGAGAIPVPLLDIAAVTAIQLDMLRELCHLYEVEYSERKGKAIISALTSSIMARFGASVIKTVPVIGWAFGGVSMVILSGATTYALGKVFDKYLREEGTLHIPDMAEAKVYFREFFEQGKELAQKLRGKKEVVA
jgi:uncharacterized protein (DUF697 family)